MDWADTTEQASFRAEVQSFIADRLPAHYRAQADRGGPIGREGGWQHDRRLGSPDAKAAAIEWEQAMHKRGWVAPHWPKEYGGG